MTLERTPLFFGNGETALFGWFHEDSDSRSSGLCAVICPPIGHESMSAHRALRHLTDGLARSGIPALRFDYAGTGDSYGADEEPGRVAAWTSSIEEAMVAVRRLSGCRAIVLIGLRFGATMAAMVAARHEVDALVLWGPCVQGRAYARELRALHLTTRDQSREVEPDSWIEPGGFVVTAETQSDIACIALDAATPRAGRVLIAARDDLAEDARLLDSWSGRGVPVEQRVLPGFSGMFLPPHSTIVPQAAIEAIVQWVADRGTADAERQPASADRHVDIAVSAAAGTVRETLFRFGDEKRLFGVITEPQQRKESAVPTILLSNAGSTHHVGPNRLYVLLARRLAAAGFRSLRFDLPAIGDSVIDGCPSENDPYPDDAVRSIGEAAEALRAAFGDDSFVVAGLCSGAHAAFHAGLKLPEIPLVEMMLINPLTFYYRKGMSLDQPPGRQHHEWQWYMKAVRRRDRWAKLLRGEVRVTPIFRTAAQRFRGIVASEAIALQRSIRGEESVRKGEDDLAHDILQIVRSGRKLTFVFSRFDPGQGILMGDAGRTVRRFRKQGLIRLWHIDDADHTFEQRRSRDVMIDSIVNHLQTRYRSGVSRASSRASPS